MAELSGEASSVERVTEKRTTLKPPDWAAPRSVSGLALEWLHRDAPVARRRGARAEIGQLRHELAAAEAAGDAERERRSSMALSRALAARGTELDTATRLARRALVLGGDFALRDSRRGSRRSVEAALAAITLRPMLEVEKGDRLARVLTRIAVFLGRTGDAFGAADALARAADANREDPVAPELRGAIAAWAPDAVSPRDAAQSYLEGNRRREARGDKAGAFEDLLRAFEVAPDSEAATELLAKSLAARGLSSAADEVTRYSASQSGERGRAMHVARMRAASHEGDFARALGAAFDADLDAESDLESSLAAVDAAVSGSAAPESFDGLLCRAGLVELCAVRLELALDDRPAGGDTRSHRARQAVRRTARQPGARGRKMD